MSTIGVDVDSFKLPTAKELEKPPAGTFKFKIYA
jgi:hypothetical protein